jgi:Na+/H+-dicarboxylate symporter
LGGGFDPRTHPLAALGIALGFLAPELAAKFKMLGDIFLKLIKTAVAPLVFFTVVHGIASAGDIKRVGKVGLRALIYFEIVSTIALAIGLLWGNLLNIGSGMHDAHPSSATAAAASAAVAKGHAPASTMDFNSVATVVVSKWSGEFIEQTAQAEYHRVLGRHPKAAL